MARRNSPSAAFARSLYMVVEALEKEIHQDLDNIPYSRLQVDDVGDLKAAADHAKAAVIRLRAVRDRYERGIAHAS